MKTYVVDLDKTLCDTKQKDDGSWDYLGALPFVDRIAKINKLYDDGNRILIETARGYTSKKNWYEKTYTQLVSFGLKFHELRTGIKPNADFYIDDKAINSEDFFECGKADYLKRESGGKTNVVLVNRVYKEATDERMLKLVDEYNFLEAIPDEFKCYFPSVTLHGIKLNKAFYEMEHYELPTLRRLMLSNQINQSEVLYWVDKITSVSCKMYKYQVIPKPADYLDTMHFTRASNRLDEISKKSDWFKSSLSKRSVTINGREYLNIPSIMDRFKKSEFIQTIQPEFVGRWSHSDLHFSNVLIDRSNDTFIMIDPRGYDYCDYYYDYGKLWHSVNGKYEMIASREFSLDGDTFELFRNQMFNLCESLKNTLPDILFRYSNESQDVVMRKTEWNEVMHFISLLPFLLDFDGVDSRSKVAYYTSVIIANEFCEKYGLN